MKKEETETHNSITLGEIELVSTDLPMEKLIDYVIAILENEIIKKYLQNLGERKILNLSKNYVS